MYYFGILQYIILILTFINVYFATFYGFSGTFTALLGAVSAWG